MLPPSAIIQKGGFSMTEHEKYQEHIRHTHDAFCKTVIRHAAIDAARSIRSRRKREISLEYLIEEKHYPFHTCALLWQYRIILSADTASEVRQMLSQKRR